jgi:hypothetical protein
MREKDGVAKQVRRSRLQLVSAHTTHCPHCAAPLDALARWQGAGSCGAASCRHQAELAQTERLKEAITSVALDAAQTNFRSRAEQHTSTLKRRPTQLVWLEHHEPRLVPLHEADRQAHRAHLESIVAENMRIERATLAPDSADDTHPQGGRLCGQCRGRCCKLGAGWRAFIDLTLLERWQQEQPGRTLAGAVDAYMALLPTDHVDDACLYQTASGCNMPRERRAEICNGFACEPLQQVQRWAAADASVAVVAVTFHERQIERAAVLERDATHALLLEAPDLPTPG